MADEGGGAGGMAGGAKDIRYDYLQERVCSTLKVSDTAFQKLIGGESK